MEPTNMEVRSVSTEVFTGGLVKFCNARSAIVTIVLPYWVSIIRAGEHKYWSAGE